MHMEDIFRNYILGHAELGLDLIPVLTHFSQYLSWESMITIVEQALDIQWIKS